MAISAERKEELGTKYLLQIGVYSEESRAELQNLDIQELIFVLSSAKYFKEKEVSLQEDYDNKIVILYDIIINRIKSSDRIWIMYSKATRYPYIDAGKKVWIFSSEEYAKEAMDYYAQQLILLEIKEITNENINQECANLYQWGMENVLVDNGQYALDIKRGDILPAPDFSNVEKINVPVMNPDVQLKMLEFFQNLYTKDEYEGKEDILRMLEADMLQAIVEGKYLIAMKMEEDGKMLLPNLTDTQDNTTWLSVFTDWDEFAKAYDIKEWKGNVAQFDDLIAFSKTTDGIVINPYGISMRITQKNLENIVNFRKEMNTEK